VVPVSAAERRLSIAILGTRGVPARYGGFETFAAELSSRLAARGHDVTVYCRGEGVGHGLWGAVRTITLPALNHKYLETVSHTLLSAVDAMVRQFDVVLLCNAANAFILPLLRARRIPVATNVDGIERKRRKWNAVGKAVYAVGESFSVLFSSQVIADAAVIADYYCERFHSRPVVISYGSELPSGPESSILDELGLRRRGYLLYVSRFEPENNPLEVIAAYRKVRTQVPLVMVGEARYAPKLRSAMSDAADERVILPGAIYGEGYQTLQRHALAYIQATEVGGTHPALVEAMGSGGLVLAHATPENREVGGDAVLYFDLRPVETLSRTIELVLAGSADVEALRGRSRARVASLYSWSRVTDAYETLLRQLG
jgi:glycosyltransferase involved in cell wall biosynthesis